MIFFFIRAKILNKTHSCKFSRGKINGNVHKAGRKRGWCRMLPTSRDDFVEKFEI